MKRWQSSFFGKTITWICAFTLVLSGFSTLSLAKAYGDTEPIGAFVSTDENELEDIWLDGDALSAELSDGNEPPDETGLKDELAPPDETDLPDLTDPFDETDPPDLTDFLTVDDPDDFELAILELIDESDDASLTDQQAESDILGSLASAPMFIGIEPMAVTLSSNAWANDYSRWSAPVRSYLARLSSGNFERVEWIGGNLIVEQYTPGFIYVSDRVIPASTYQPSDLIAGQSVIFLGYYSGTTNNYVATGQLNDAQNNNLTVIRITKYSKDWTYVSNYELKGANTVRPGDAGSFRMLEYGGNLYIRTSHLMYTYTDGLRHQANMTIVINQNTMTYVEGYYGIYNISAKYGYVSHSFNQFIGVLNGKVYGVDHGDASPRAISLKSIMDSGTASYALVWPISDLLVGHYNDTYASVGGFETSNTRQTLLVAGTSADQSRVATSSTPWKLAQNVFLTVSSANLATTNRIAITNYADSDTYWATTPQLVKLNEDRFMIVWGLGTPNASSRGFSSYQESIRYIFVDGNGNKLTSIYSAVARLSDCQPIVVDGKVTWYVTGGGGTGIPTFYSIDGTTGAFISHVPPTITTASLPTVLVGSSYNQTLAASGATPITWSLASGPLPPGLSLSSTGVISGTTTAGGVYSFTVRATNIYGAVTKVLSITVNAPPVVTGPTSMTLTQGYAATSSGVFTVTGTPAPYVNGYSVTSTAADHLKWNNSTKRLDIAAGLGPGNYSITLNFYNGVAPNASITFALTVNSAPGITGPTSMTLTQGYAASYSAVFTITGFPAPTVTKTSGNSLITWNNTSKRLDIAAGLAPNSYQVVLTASNGVSPNATITFTLTVNAAPTSVPDIVYRTHVQNIGNQAAVSNGAVSGTSGMAYRLEGIWIGLSGTYSGGVSYRTHVQDVGWQGWVSNNTMSGTSGRSLRLEAIQIRLDGDIATKFDIYYRVHCENYGWLGWAKNGEYAGSEGLSLRLEAIQIVLVVKGGPAPTNLKGITSWYSNGYISGALYRTHVQNVGWQGWVGNGAMSGTSGRSLRLEGIEIRLTSDISGGISYRTHVENIGWQNFVNNGAMSGTSGRALRLEAIEINLTGAAATTHDVWYRVHIEDYGWLGWAKNGAPSGSEGKAKRLEAIEILVLPKGSPAPGSTAQPFIK